MPTLTLPLETQQTLRQTTDPNAYDLALGQDYEAYAARILTSKGLPTYQPQQHFILSTDHKQYRERGKCPIVDDPLSGGLRSRHFDPRLLRPYQRDLLVKVGKTRRLSVEVKALTPAAFRKHQIWVGCCPKWDLKQFRVAALLLIDQETKEIWVAPEASEWLRVKDQEDVMAYAVPRHLLSPVDAWIDAIKDSYADGLKELA
ncbi:hypothetical protein H6F90_21955 [Trichocoleus sp. FACHB-591]|uniref:hypothetical protein n=1 Tax=Trichocoleus sp. FACHB-591 TaxID=2692872 RepID=UPI001682796C|nr:hypothetical protein [Trichocoleus sp. FACHB-591]MBD2097741.1 hypothetical protein [Trichocoleus sp. FACHB-591]